MKKNKLSALLCAVLITCNVLPAFAPVSVHAGIKQTLVEGSGQSPDIEVIRVDEDGNEIRENNENGSSSSKNDGQSEKDPADTDGIYTYEEDLSGFPYVQDEQEMTTLYISTAEDLKKLALDCRLDTWSRDKNIVLQDDIILDGSDFKYIPIFGGIFDGQGHTISGLAVSDAESYTGLFCITQESAVIKDLHVQGSFVPSGKPLATGGIVGDNYGIITGCSFEGNIEGYDYTGGIAGYNEQTGTISTCRSSGYIMGMHFTGGVTGYNLGVINACTNDAKINIKNVDQTVSIKDVDISKYTNKLLNLFGDNNKQDSTSVLNNPVDAGGICGYSQGTILSCTNNALVGYEHVGYNIGGIVGRQNGYVDLCVNNGEIYGRKDVGGIVGQAEPYVIIDITEDIIGQLTANMNTLHDLVGMTLNDAGNESNLVSARLNMVKSFTDKALNDTSYLANETENWVNGVMDSGSEVLNRIDYALDESVKSGGVFDQTQAAFKDASKAAENLTKAIDDLDIYKYMTPEETVSYNKAKENISKATADYEKYYNECFDKDYKYNYYKYIKTTHNTPAYYGISSNLTALDENGTEIPWDTLSDNASYAKISHLVHRDKSTTPPTDTPFPAPDGQYAEKDKELDTAATATATGIVEAEADEKFRAQYGEGYASYLEKNVEIIARIVAAHEQQMSEDTRRDAKYAVDYTKKSLNDLNNAVGEAKSIASNLSSRSNISLPKLSPEYQARSNSLIANIQGMSDNLGCLNNEMNASNQQLVDDMGKVNDQFNVIMLLIADAIDGVLDQDYTDVYEDNSAQVAEDCTDATIADSINYGRVHGDINTAGIAGTMAIEYDFDLESDVTGIKDAATGTTYRTKCVLRRNKNDGHVEGVKSYVGGICGLQEMGTVLRCQNYGKLKSGSGDYIGGISGESLSTIRACCTKGILDGRSYIGGIAGKGYDITSCYSLPSIYGSGSCLGAIAGDNDQKGRLKDNYFVSDEFAGIDRVSYSGKAEPISYDELLAAEGVPSEFRTIRVSFIVDDETITVKEYNYGDSITSLPLELPDGDYIKWHWDNSKLNNIHSDTELIGEEARYITTLAGLQLRESGQSDVLVDGQFTEEDNLLTELSGVSSKEKVIETWKLTIPDDKAREHLIRYCPPSSVKEIKIRLLDGSETQEVKLTPMGKYYTFTAAGNEVRFEVEDAYVNPLVKYAVYEIAGAAVLVILIILLVLHSRRKKKQIRRNVKTPSPDDDINDIIDIDLDKAEDEQ